jgi:hypothetical protein
MSRKDRQERRASAPAEAPLPSMRPPVQRILSRSETHDLSMIIKDRTKVLKAHAEEEAAKRLAEFEQHMATVYKWDQDETWEKITREAGEVVLKAQNDIAERAKALGIPSQFAPGLELSWRSRGQNAMQGRRAEFRAVAKTQVDAMLKAATTRIEKQSLDLRTQVVAMGILSPDAKVFLESLAPVEDAMQQLDFKKVELQYNENKQKRLSGPGSRYVDYDD